MMYQKEEAPAVRNYKDTVFRRLFSDKEKLLSLYNAVNGTDYDRPEELTIVTLENAIYMTVKNDLAFLVDFHLHLYEHQASVNPNMPLRFLQYVAKEYEKLIAQDTLYGRRLIKLPAPMFVVFYNGTAEQPEEQTLYLSEAFYESKEEPQLELKVRVLNLNRGYNTKIKEQCKVLEEYMQYVDCVRRRAQKSSFKEAVALAVEECIEKGILRDFLIANKAEVISMSIFEYDEEKTRKALEEYGYERGEAAGIELGNKRGIEQGIKQGIKQERVSMIRRLFEKRYSAGEIADILEIDEEYVSAVIEQLTEEPGATDKELVSRLQDRKAKDKI